MDEARLESAAAAIGAATDASAAVGGGRSAVLALPTDVTRLVDVQRLKDKVYGTFGEVAVLMNNSGTALGGGPWDSYDRWRHVLEANLWGVINGLRTFT